MPWKQPTETHAREKTRPRPAPARLASPLAAAAALTLAPATASPAEEELIEGAAVVRHEGIDAAYVRAIARTVDRARSAAVREFGFAMPESVVITIRADPGGEVRLFNDGKDRFRLTLRSERDLRKPSASGVFHLYGLCHEVAHLAMYLPVRDHSWLTTAGAEGWAHYLGSRLVDAVHQEAGPDLWPDRYDYLQDGMARLKRQYARRERTGTVEGAGRWAELIKIVGDRGMADVFEAWGKAEIDPADPAPAVAAALVETRPGKARELRRWVERAAPLLLKKRPVSGFAAAPVDPDELAGKPRELAHDDGRPAGRKSLAGSGHAVRFTVPGAGFALRGIRFYGTRYGQKKVPGVDFTVWLCDGQFREIARWTFPLEDIPYASTGWVERPLGPVRVPPEFILCVGFNPTATQGFFLHHDDGAGGGETASVGLPGTAGRPFRGGDWLIRATVDLLEETDALR